MDQPVETSHVLMQSVRVTVEDLTVIQGQRLVAWVGERYGPPVSYSYVQLANRFTVVVDAAGEWI